MALCSAFQARNYVKAKKCNALDFMGGTSIDVADIGEAIEASAVINVLGGFGLCEVSAVFIVLEVSGVLIL